MIIKNYYKKEIVMQEYIVIKKGASIRHCINLPEDFMDMELEIKIRPLIKMGKISEKLKKLYNKYHDVSPFKGIENPTKWQRELRDEWE
jgi:hypothetical protein